MFCSNCDKQLDMHTKKCKNFQFAVAKTVASNNFLKNLLVLLIVGLGVFFIFGNLSAGLGGGGVLNGTWNIVPRSSLRCT